MDCPICRKPMVILEFKEVELDFCPACKGCWLDAGELALILQGTGKPAREWPAAGGRSKRRCPRCRKHMRVGPLPGTHVDIDVCPAGHGMWLDEGELTAILRAKATDDQAGPLAAYCQSLLEADLTHERISEGRTD